jgi:hypothetical protein
MTIDLRRDAGVSLTETLIAVTITMTALGIAMTTFDSLANTREAVTLLTDTNQNLRSSLNVVTRDLLSAGRGIPVGGIPIPFGAQPVVRPSPNGTTLTFPLTDVRIPAVSPGNGLGPVVNSISTDIISVLMLDPNLPSDWPITNVAPDGSTAMVAPGVDIDDVSAGDLILFNNGNQRYAVQMVTDRVEQTLFFATGDGLRLNQRGAADGTIMQLRTDGEFKDMSASRILMISYYVDNSNASRPQLMRRVNMRADRAIGVAVENFQITYDLVDGVTNPVNVGTPVAPLTPNQIRKANVFLAGRSYAKVTKSQQFVRTSLSTQVSLRNLSFVDRYAEERPDSENPYFQEDHDLHP